MSKTFSAKVSETSAEAKFNESYGKIRNALVNSVQAAHTDWTDFDASGNAVKICNALRAYKFVFSTNYDLLLYWSIMSDTRGFVDYFFGKDGKDSLFDITDTEIFHWNQNSTRVLYLHGALHLAYNPLSGRVKKINHDGTSSILDRFRTDTQLIPLFVAEGTWRDKLSAIYSSEYLSFALSQLSRNRSPVVIFGHSLNAESDKHLIDVIKSWRDALGNRLPIAISVFPGSGDHSIIEFKNTLMSQLDHANLTFFDSTSHPLGDAALKIA